MTTSEHYQHFLIRYYAGVTNDLPLVSPIARNLMSRSRHRNIPMSDLHNAFLTDPFLAAKIVGAANSMFYARGGAAILSIEKALSRVGAQYARNLLHEAPRFSARIDPLLIDTLWAHAVSVARVAQALVSFLPAPRVDANAAYAIALIHDIGYVLQLHYSPNSQGEISRHLFAHESDTESSQHAFQGQELTRFWVLPHLATDVVGQHHSIESCSDANVEWLVRVLCASERIVAGHRDINPHASYLNISQDSITHLLQVYSAARQWSAGYLAITPEQSNRRGQVRAS